MSWCGKELPSYHDGVNDENDENVDAVFYDVNDDDDDDDDDDIYIMMQFCLSVTKNHHFLKRSVPNHESGFSWFLVGFHVFSR